VKYLWAPGSRAAASALVQRVGGFGRMSPREQCHDSTDAWSVPASETLGTGMDADANQEKHCRRRLTSTQ
jgi:hypothetical protein